MAEIVGVISEDVVDLLGLEPPKDYNIYIGKQNIEHMIQSHPYDYQMYGNEIPSIIEFPDYIGYHNESIEYVKEYKLNHEFIKVAVRVSLNGRYFARTIFSLNKERVQSSLKNGSLIKYVVE